MLGLLVPPAHPTIPRPVMRTTCAGHLPRTPPSPLLLPQRGSLSHPVHPSAFPPRSHSLIPTLPGPGVHVSEGVCVCVCVYVMGSCKSLCVLNCLYCVFMCVIVSELRVCECVLYKLCASVVSVCFHMNCLFCVTI